MKRRSVVKVRLTQKEKDSSMIAAKHCGMSVSTWIRGLVKRALSGPTPGKGVSEADFQRAHTGPTSGPLRAHKKRAHSDRAHFSRVKSSPSPPALKIPPHPVSGEIRISTTPKDPAAALCIRNPEELEAPARAYYSGEDLALMPARTRALVERLAAPDYDPILAGDCRRCHTGPRAIGELCVDCAPRLVRPALREVHA